MPRLALAAALLLAATGAQAAKGHAHGVGVLEVAIDGKQLTIALELPLDAAVGFERAPRTAAEKTALEAAAKVLNDGAALFAPTPAAGCALKGATVAVPHLAGKATDAEHADIDAEYVFECAAPAALKGFETALFKHFRRLYRIEAQRIGPQGQGAGRLTPKTPALAW